MRRTLAVGLVAALAAAGALAQPGTVGVPEHQITDTPEDLPEGQGRDETFYTCVACHSVQVVRRQGLSRERWDQTIAEMVERHGMPEPEAADRALILDYLARTLPPRTRPGRPNPFLGR